MMAREDHGMDMLGRLEAGAFAYAELVQRLRAGERVGLEAIKTIVLGAGRGLADLVADVFGPGAACRPGQPCPKCRRGRLVTYCTRRTKVGAIRYLRCNCCRFTPGRKCVVSSEAVWGRRVRTNR